MPTEVFFQSGGLRCAADLYLPPDLGKGERRPGLVVGHGFSLVKSMLAGQASYFQRAGFVVLTLDYRSFGNSEGESRGQLFPMNEVEDFRNAISYLQSRSEVDPDRIGIWGASFAGALVSYVAAVDRRVKATVSVVPVTDGYLWLKLLRGEHDWDALLKALEEDRARRFAGEPSRRIPVTGLSSEYCALPSEPEIVDFFAQAKELHPTWRDTITLESIERILEFSPLNMVQRITPRPYMIISTAKHDVVHPADTVAELHARAREPKRLVFLPYEQTELYSEPGLGASNAVAAGFFAENLQLRIGATAEA